jgi:glycosyltransferase involved in cell wall biosynthesis
MSISMILVTHRRAHLVERVMDLNLERAGDKLDELIWVDNASPDDARKIIPKYNPRVSILHNENLGVAIAFNRGVACSTGDFLLLNDGDVLLPEGWLLTIKKYLSVIPNTGVLSIPHDNDGRHENVDWGNIQVTMVGGLPMCLALIRIGLAIRSRNIWNRVGYLREGLGFYGNEDTMWNDKANSLQGEFVNYMIPRFMGLHMGNSFVGEPEPEGYWDFKMAEAKKEGKQEKIAVLREQGFPPFNPYM